MASELVQNSQNSSGLTTHHTKKSLFEQIACATPETSYSSKTDLALCALKKQIRCGHCHGKGIRLARPSGSYAQAEICTCIRHCLSCRGSAVTQSITENGSKIAKSCMNPPPKRRANLFNQAGIPLRYAKAKLTNLDSKSDQLHRAAERIRRWIAELQQKKSSDPTLGFVLQGDVGIGKTYLAAATAKHLAYHGYAVKFVDFFQLVTDIKIRHAQQIEWTSSLFTPLIEVDFLIIDELGKGRRTEFEQTVIDQLVAQRYNRNKTIIATTNCSVEKIPANHRKESEWDISDFSQSSPLIKAVGARVYSRLTEMCSFWQISDAEDLREQIAQKSRHNHLEI